MSKHMRLTRDIELFREGGRVVVTENTMVKLGTDYGKTIDVTAYWSDPDLAEEFWVRPSELRPVTAFDYGFD